MIDDISDIKAYYEGEEEDGRLDRHQLEHDLTWRYLDLYLPTHGSILDLGAGSGRYALELARRGYSITAFELSDTLTALCEGKLRQAGLEKRVRCIVGDARDLSGLQGARYDAALVMGPLYHLVYEEDRRLVVRQVYALLRPGGLVFSAFISRYGVMGDVMKRIPEWIDKTAEVRSLFERGRDVDDRPHKGFRGYFATVEEIAPLHEAEGFETLMVAALEPAISADDDSYNVLEGSRREAWLELLFEISTEPSVIGASRHLLYVGKRPQGNAAGET